MFLWDISNTRRKAKFKNCFLLAARLFNTASGVAFFFPPSLHMQEKQALRFHNLESNNRWLQSHCVHFCKLGSKFESTVELNCLGWHKLALDSAHVKLDVWSRPQIVLDKEENYKLLLLPMALGTSQKAKGLSTTETTLTATWLKSGYLWHILPYNITYIIIRQKKKIEVTTARRPKRN